MRLRGTTQVHAEVGEIAMALESEKDETGTYGDLLKPGIRGRLFVAMGLLTLTLTLTLTLIKGRLFVAMGLQVLQQATGVNSIFYYAPTIFADVGVEEPLVAGLICGAANLAGTLMGIYLGHHPP